MRVESLITTYRINNFTQAAPTCMPVFLESTGYSKGSLWPCLFWVFRVWLFISELWLFSLLISCLCFSSWSFGWAFTSRATPNLGSFCPCVCHDVSLGGQIIPLSHRKISEVMETTKAGMVLSEEMVPAAVGLALSLSVLAVHMSHSGEASD